MISMFLETWYCRALEIILGCWAETTEIVLFLYEMLTGPSIREANLLSALSDKIAARKSSVLAGANMGEKLDKLGLSCAKLSSSWVS